MDFLTIEQIRKHFDIVSDNPDEIKRELRQIIKTIHPDKNGGHFRTKADEKYFFEIQNAIEFIENINTSLVTRQEMTALTQIFKDLIPSAQLKINESTKRLETKIQSSIKFYKRKHLFPKVTTTSISIIITLVWLFPKTVLEHPVLKHYLTTDNPVFSSLWLAAVFTCAYVWIVLKTFEQKDEEYRKGLCLETNLNKIFTKFIFFHSYNKKDDFLYFNKDELIEFITKYDFKKDKFRDHINRMKSNIKIFIFLVRNVFPSIGQVDLDLAQSISDVIIEKGLTKNVIEKVESQSINDTYKTKC